MRLRCVAFDRVVETDLVVPGAIAAPVGDPPDATIGIEPGVASNAALSDLPNWSFADGVLDFSPPGVARYRCTARSIVVTPALSAASADIAGLLVATALPAMLWLQGAFVLHATAVIPAGDDRALAIAGPSGIGKSTLAAAFLGRGARLVADDSIVVRSVDGRPVCSGLAGGYHLGADGEGERMFHPVPSDVACRSAPLGAIVVLGTRTSRVPARLEPVGAVEALLANRHRPNAVRFALLEPRSLADAAWLARTVPVCTWPVEDAHTLLDEGARRAMTRMGDR